MTATTFIKSYRIGTSVQYFDDDWIVDDAAVELPEEGALHCDLPSLPGMWIRGFYRRFIAS